MNHAVVRVKSREQLASDDTLYRKVETRAKRASFSALSSACLHIQPAAR